MTILQRKNQKRNAKKCQTPKKNRLSSIFAFDTSIAQHSPDSLNGNTMKDTSRTAVDKGTARVIKNEVLSLLDGRQGSPCSKLEMCSILAQSNEIRDAYLAASQTASPHLHLWNTTFGSIFGRSKKRDAMEMEKRYEITNAFSRLASRAGSSTSMVVSWQDARNYLENEIVFPVDGSWDVEERGIVARTAALFLDRDLPHLSAELEPSTIRFRQITGTRLPELLGDRKGDDLSPLEREIEAREAAREKARKSQAVEQVQRRLEEQEKEEEAKRLASALLREFTDEENAMVREAIWGYGPGNEIIQAEGSDSVQRDSMRKLQPGQWLNDEVIHFFFVMLSKRDEEMCAADPGRKRSHFFKSFFMTKLLNEGNSDPNLDGKFTYNNVKRWSKKVPGKDLFALNKVFFPINQGGMHWVCAVAFMQEKKIRFYDSMGSSGKGYLNHIFRYLQEDHKSKKNCPLPDLDKWQLIECTPDTPRQGNGYDCGVFTCMFADFVAKDCPLLFTQHHVDQCRQRIALSICKGKAII